MKFSLTVNSQQQDGFKHSFSCDNAEELQVAKELSEKLIEKISKIEVSINNDNNDGDIY